MTIDLQDMFIQLKARRFFYMPPERGDERFGNVDLRGLVAGTAVHEQVEVGAAFVMPASNKVATCTDAVNEVKLHQGFEDPVHSGQVDIGQATVLMNPFE